MKILLIILLASAVFLPAAVIGIKQQAQTASTIQTTDTSTNEQSEIDVEKVVATPSAQPTISPKTDVLTTTSVKKADGDISDCIGPDGVTFKATIEACKEFNTAWGNYSDNGDQSSPDSLSDQEKAALLNIQRIQDQVARDQLRRVINTY